MKRFAWAFLAMLIAAGFSACGSGSDSAAVSAASTDGKAVTSVQASETEEYSVTSAVPDVELTSQQVTTAEEVEIVPNVLKYTEFKISVEAQDGVYGKSLKEAATRKGASEGSYISGFDSADAEIVRWSCFAELPDTQYYNIVFVAASDKGTKAKCTLDIDNAEYAEFSTGGTGSFEAVGFENILLEKGEHSIGFTCTSGKLDFDYAVITASDAVSKLDLSFVELPELSNKQSSYKTRAVYRYICGIYGTNILSGQYQSVSTNAESEAVYRLTGHYPAVRFGDLVSYTEEDTYADDVDKAVEWAREGGLVGYVWHWQDPAGGEGYYIDGEQGLPDELITDFDLSKAVTDIDVSLIPLEDMETMCSQGGVSPECLAVVRDIDIVSEQLLKLRDEGVTVLWRPLHEAGGSWFWWGRDVESYKWLWQLMYKRMTEYHGLNNLIWVWNGQNPDWYVGDEYCDIISADIYGGDGESALGAFMSLRRICPQKPLALSECGQAPDVQKLADEKTMWSFFGIWSGSYVIDEYGNYSDTIISKEDMTELYSNSIVICRDELPDFEKLAADIEQEDFDRANKASGSGKDTSSAE